MSLLPTAPANVTALTSMMTGEKVSRDLRAKVEDRRAGQAAFASVAA